MYQRSQDEERVDRLEVEWIRMRPPVFNVATSGGAMKDEIQYSMREVWRGQPKK